MFSLKLEQGYQCRLSLYRGDVSNRRCKEKVDRSLMCNVLLGILLPDRRVHSPHQILIHNFFGFSSHYLPIPIWQVETCFDGGNYGAKRLLLNMRIWVRDIWDSRTCINLAFKVSRFSEVWKPKELYKRGHNEHTMEFYILICSSINEGYSKYHMAK